jgi:hypothetical protein
MISPSDEDLINAASKYFYYRAVSQRGDVNLVKSTLDAEKQNILDQITLAEIEEETYNEMYLNNKKNPNTYGLFSKIGLQTTQDWVLAYFFFSYIVFGILVLLTILKTSVNKSSTILTGSGILIIVGIVFYVIILNYC